MIIIITRVIIIIEKCFFTQTERGGTNLSRILGEAYNYCNRIIIIFIVIVLVTIITRYR